jgi:hypothetical protein
MVNHAIKHIDMLANNLSLDEDDGSVERNVTVIGMYKLIVSETMLDELERDHGDKKINVRGLHHGLIRVLKRDFQDIHAGNAEPFHTQYGYTRVKIDHDDNKTGLFYAHPNLLGSQWYDWAYVHFQITSSNGNEQSAYYPSLILGFHNVEKEVQAVVQCAVNPVEWSTIQTNLIVKFQLSDHFDESYVRVPISSIIHPLCVIKDYGGNSCTYM